MLPTWQVDAPRLQPSAKPINLRKDPTVPGFFDVLDWMLALMPVLPGEEQLRRSFDLVGIIPGRPFVIYSSAEEQQVLNGMRAGLATIQQQALATKSTADVFGSREFLKDNYLARAVGAYMGILGNAAAEFLGVGALHGHSGECCGGVSWCGLPRCICWSNTRSIQRSWEHSGSGAEHSVPCWFQDCSSCTAQGRSLSTWCVV